MAKYQKLTTFLAAHFTLIKLRYIRGREQRCLTVRLPRESFTLLSMLHAPEVRHQHL